MDMTIHAPLFVPPRRLLSGFRRAQNCLLHKEIAL